MYIYNQEGKKEHIIIDGGRTILAAQLVMKSTHKATVTKSNQAGRVWVYGIPKDHMKKNVTLISGSPLNIAGDEDPENPALTPLEPIVTVLPMDFTSREYIGLIIEIKDSQNVKSISDVHLTFSQMPLVEPGINNNATDYSITLKTIEYDEVNEEYLYSETGEISLDVLKGASLTLPGIKSIIESGTTYCEHTGWRYGNVSFSNGTSYDNTVHGLEFNPTWKFRFNYDLTGTGKLAERLIELRDLAGNAGKVFSVSIDGTVFNNTKTIPAAEDEFESIENVVKENILSNTDWNDSKISIFATVGSGNIPLAYDWDGLKIEPTQCPTYSVPYKLDNFINDIAGALMLASVET